MGAYGVESEFVFNYRGAKQPVVIKVNADKLLKAVLASGKFELIELFVGNKGTHSMRKFAQTFA